ncbi:hypothetical protein [Euzebya tangerina]|uniref:hypothetical protein n=1 Tax=Euzebya tangerina TaxID=591198 RepID=UPI000E312F45|nr:hypothetical protein [Euzebya tangerina]
MPLRLSIALVLLVVALTGCGLIETRQNISEEQARELLDQAVDLVASGRSDRLCALSPSEATTCPDTLDTAGPVAPTTPPAVTCVVALPDEGPLRRGTALVVEGTDGNGEAYTSEFIVFDDGDAVGVLDAVYWSGLAVQSYNDDTVSWRFDSGSTLCQDGAFPPGDPPSTGAPSERSDTSTGN